MTNRGFITGVSGLILNDAEREFIRAERPWGFILFKRNIESPAQVAALIGELRKAAGMAEAPVLIDQEGGRVQRLGPPHWPVYPPGASFGALYDIDPKLGLAAARLSSRLIAADLIDFKNSNLPTLKFRVCRLNDSGIRRFSLIANNYKLLFN